MKVLLSLLFALTLTLAWQTSVLADSHAKGDGDQKTEQTKAQDADKKKKKKKEPDCE